MKLPALIHQMRELGIKSVKLTPGGDVLECELAMAPSAGGQPEHEETDEERKKREAAEAEYQEQMLFAAAEGFPPSIPS